VSALLNGTRVQPCQASGLTAEPWRHYCWGLTASGELGDGTTTRRLTPVAVAGGLFFSQVSAGGYQGIGSHTCGRTPGAVAYCWGSNNGQLGDGTAINRLTPVAVARGG
jgi:hypothetical protein